MHPAFCYLSLTKSYFFCSTSAKYPINYSFTLGLFVALTRASSSALLPLGLLLRRFDALFWPLAIAS